MPDPVHMYSLPVMSTLVGTEEFVGTVNHVSAKASLAALRAFVLAGLSVPIPDQTIVFPTANYTLALTDKNNAVGMNVATANVLTVPPNSSVAFPVGSRIDVYQHGAGATSLAYGAPVVVHNANGLTFGVQYAGGTLLKLGPDEWIAFGGFSGTSATPAGAFKKVIGDQSGNHNTTSTAYVDVAAAYTLTIPAAVNDILRCVFNFCHQLSANNTNYFRFNIGGVDKGPGWTNPPPQLGYSVMAQMEYWHTVVAGDISAGAVTVKPRFRTSSGSATATIFNENTGDFRVPVFVLENKGPSS